MPAIDFPNSPQVNSTFTVGERTWKWTGTTWDVVVVTQITGPTGPTGPQGVSGGSFVFTQASPASTWTIAHNLGYRPNISVVDSAGSQVEGNTVWTDNNNLTITFSGAFSGVAYLS